MVGTRREYVAAAGATSVAVTLALLELWPFGAPRRPDADASIWEVLVYDGAVLGFLKLAMVMFALYGIASVPALIAGGRWAKGVGTSGVVADDARAVSDRALGQAERTIEELQERLLQVEAEHSALAATVDRDTSPD